VLHDEEGVYLCATAGGGMRYVFRNMYHVLRGVGVCVRGDGGGYVPRGVGRRGRLDVCVRVSRVRFSAMLRGERGKRVSTAHPAWVFKALDSTQEVLSRGFGHRQCYDWFCP